MQCRKRKPRGRKESNGDRSHGSNRTRPQMSYERGCRNMGKTAGTPPTDATCLVFFAVRARDQRRARRTDHSAAYPRYDVRFPYGSLQGLHDFRKAGFVPEVCVGGLSGAYHLPFRTFTVEMTPMLGVLRRSTPLAEGLQAAPSISRYFSLRHSVERLMPSRFAAVVWFMSS